jgi:hypothetical protein
MKAYSVVDEEVGYCQGMSFVGGLLLVHTTEEQAYILFKTLMYGANLRMQYMPDMAQLKLQLYQLTRIVHDKAPAVYEHFVRHEIEPFLYATPWFLSLFCTQFPSEFCTRVLGTLLFGPQSDVQSP